MLPHDFCHYSMLCVMQFTFQNILPHKCLSKDQWHKTVFSWLRPEHLVYCMAYRDSTGVFLCYQIFSVVVWRPGISIAGQLIVSGVLFLDSGYYNFLFVRVHSLTR